uniref:hypothetical protein n=1 Tax=Gemmatimonas sp. TaxID=1962908 RepID=UPI0037C0D9B6
MRPASSAMLSTVVSVAVSTRVLGATALFGVAMITTAIATAIAHPLAAQVVPIVPVVETGVPFDSAGRITV